ncbi:uncharacterized protein MONBRDRAFT_27747 [Monosiga brevicollis MX1]|uniref:Prolyl 4-hydroxylase alpha subunit domain-containing protein n=1 Tax=Monosiga brevicollis TaxID=81824 RepID=A9V671_MONBE|nr:uncharacterized protein MONBRDRAFT_27747 [Monosiga brevicollis MX1]EDQ86937.1 predicted protein [Monosiga brevicollis MX1]|eukprot:XP_001748176.1 hypothetical protein [Monosiga brevicollis MX1]
MAQQTPFLSLCLALAITLLASARLVGAGAGGAMWNSQPVSNLRIQGANIEDVNGLYQAGPLVNGHPSFIKTLNNSSRYELFVHKGDSEHDRWWNIQKVLLKHGKIDDYGPVVYVNKVPTRNEPQPQLPRNDWQQLFGLGDFEFDDDLQVFHLPVCSDKSECQSGDDDCLNYFLRPLEEEAYFTALPSPRRILQCPDLSHWIRTIDSKEVRKLRTQFITTGIVSIPNFLRPEIFARLQDAVHQPVLSDVWQASFPRDDGMAHTIPWHVDNLELIAEWLTRQHRHRQQSIYAYSFTRTVDTIDGRLRFFYPELFGQMRDLVSSQYLHNILSQIAHHDYELSTLFISRYTSGDFLNRHSDSVETRRIAFTYHLTKEWKAEYGGLLHMMNENDWDEVIRTLVPASNTFTFFDVSEEWRVLPHFVSEIAADIATPRIAATGWMSFKSDHRPFTFWPATDAQWEVD